MITEDHIIEALKRVAEYALQFSDTEDGTRFAIGVEPLALNAIALARAEETVEEMREDKPLTTEKLVARLATEWAEGFGAGVEAKSIELGPKVHR